MFIWSVPTVLNQLEKHVSELRHFLQELCQSSDLTATVANQFPKLTPISIDYALMENAERVLNIEAPPSPQPRSPTTNDTNIKRLLPVPHRI